MSCARQHYSFICVGQLFLLERTSMHVINFTIKRWSISFDKQCKMFTRILIWAILLNAYVEFMYVLVRRSWNFTFKVPRYRLKPLKVVLTIPRNRFVFKLKCEICGKSIGTPRPFHFSRRDYRFESTHFESKSKKGLSILLPEMTKLTKTFFFTPMVH